MNEFKQAAENAAEELVPEQGYGGDLSTMLATAIIVKHYAPLAEQHALLVELAKLEVIMRSKEGNWLKAGLRIGDILEHPLIAPLLKEEK